MSLARGRYPGGGGAAGLPYKIVDVLGVDDDGIATCLDRFGNEQKISVSACRTKALYPRTGERWVIDQQYEGWTFAMVVGGFKIPEVTGSRTGADPLSVSLLQALAELGLVMDRTTP